MGQKSLLTCVIDTTLIISGSAELYRLPLALLI